MNFVRPALLRDIASLAPYFLVFAAIGFFSKSIYEMALAGLTNRVNGDHLIPVIPVVATGLSFFLRRWLLGTPFILSAMFTSLLAVYLASGYGLKVFFLTLYSLGIAFIARLAWRRLERRGCLFENDKSALVLIMISINFALIATTLLLPVKPLWICYGVNCLGVFGCFAFIMNAARDRRLDPSHRVSLSGHRVSLLEVITALTVSCVATLGALFSIGPLTEWDSVMAHIITVKNYWDTESLQPYVFSLQSYMFGFHHISAVPFYGLAGEFGLKFFNFMFIFAAAYSIWDLLRFASSSQNQNSSLWLLGAAVISSPTILTTAGTFQYDVPLIVFFAVSLKWTWVAWTRMKKIDTKIAAFWVVLALSLGFYIKQSFLLVIPVFSLSFLILSWRVRTVPWGAISLAVILASLFFLKSWWHTGDFLFPYDHVGSRTKGDWMNYGHEVPRFLRFLTMLPLATFQTSSYGQLAPFTLGFGYLLSFLAIPFHIGTRRARPAFFILLLSIFVYPMISQYVRYLVFIFAGLSLFLWLDLIRDGQKKWVLGAKHLSLVALTGLNLLMAPNLNWWVVVHGNALLHRYSESAERDRVWGEPWRELNHVSRELYPKKALLLSDFSASRYFWAHLTEFNSIVPNTWQANIEFLSPLSGREFESKAHEKGFNFVIVPNDEMDKYSSKVAHLQKTKVIGNFNVFSLGDTSTL